MVRARIELATPGFSVSEPHGKRAPSDELPAQTRQRSRCHTASECAGRHETSDRARYKFRYTPRQPRGVVLFFGVSADPNIRRLWWLTVCAFVADTLTTGYALLTGVGHESNGAVARVIRDFGVVPGLLGLLVLRIGGTRLVVAMDDVLRRRDAGFPLAKIGLTVLAVATWVVVGQNMAVLV